MLLHRTKGLAIETIKLVSSFPHKTEFYVIGNQLVKSATSTAANYRAVNRARSDKEFFAKLSIVIEECDETLFWIEILEESNLIEQNKLIKLKDETLELLKIFSKSRKTAKSNNSKTQSFKNSINQKLNNSIIQ
ncbi:MAG: four helix bundle protein [Saprospiraceae bacterium]|nr:four helix bundle protein [Saprospiraceae bacterium]